MEQLKRDLINVCAKYRTTVPILPDSCKYYGRTKNGELFVVEQTPQIRTIFVHQKYFRLSFPYVIFSILFRTDRLPSQSVNIYFNNKPLATLKDQVYQTNLPNVQGVFLCTGREGLDDAQDAQDILVDFWQSEFNYELCDNFDSMCFRETKLSSFSAWQEATKIDPRFILNVDFTPVGSLEASLRSTMEFKSFIGGSFNLAFFLEFHALFAKLETNLALPWCYRDL